MHSEIETKGGTGQVPTQICATEVENEVALDPEPHPPPNRTNPKLDSPTKRRVFMCFSHSNDPRRFSGSGQRRRPAG